MPEQTFVYETSVEFPSGFLASNLLEEIQNPSDLGDKIVTACDRVDTGQNDFGSGLVPAVFVTFRDELSAADRLLLDGDTVPATAGTLIAKHDPTARHGEVMEQIQRRNSELQRQIDQL